MKKMRFTTKQAIQYLEKNRRIRHVVPGVKTGCGCGGKIAKYKTKAVQKTPPSVARRIFM